uniref:Ig-like domain-containing protein n=1 Tax=Knipowitschia caucasica TaxID=637954 RepID=A0AAV2L253_KNICA
MLWVDVSSQNKPEELHVSCLVGRLCVLPCTLPSSALQCLQWFKQDSLILNLSSELQPQPAPSDPLSGRATLSRADLSRGNASLLVRDSAPRDRGRYRCRVKTAAGDQDQDVIVKVQAPIRSLSVELSRLSGYEEVKCSVRHVFPPPRVTWSTEPPTFQDLRPLTRKQLEDSGLYAVESRLRTMGQGERVYVCTATSPYGGESWSASYRHRDVRGVEGADLTLPCFSPSFLNARTLSWTFSHSNSSSHILTYRVDSGEATSAPEWSGHAELDGYRVQLGDGSLRLMDTSEKHTGRYSCVFSSDRNSHTERLEVTVTGTGKHSSPEQPSYWWLVGLLVGLLVLTLVVLLVYNKIRGGLSKPKSDAEEATELHPVKGADSTPSTGGSNEPSTLS